MSIQDEKRKSEEQNQRFREALASTLGDAIRKPISARLGYEEEDGTQLLKIPSDRTDQPARYYFHESAGTGFQAEAFLQPGALQDWQIRFDAPIRVEKDVLSGEWQIIGIDARYAAQFFEGVDVDDGVIYGYDKFAPGLLTQTLPASMKAKVLAGAYRFGSRWRYHPTQETVDWSEAPYSANVPTVNLKQCYVLIQIDFETGVLDYKYGIQISSSVSPIQAYNLNLAIGDDTILPNTDPGKFRSGYIRLVKGMNRITRIDHIWAIQDYLMMGGNSLDDAPSMLNRIVTADGEVVVDDETGEVVFVELE